MEPTALHLQKEIQATGPASNEAWRFTPNGESNVAFSWLNEDNEVIGTDSVINVCPANETSTYTAQAIYTNCNGDVITETDTVTSDIYRSLRD